MMHTIGGRFGSSAYCSGGGRARGCRSSSASFGCCTTKPRSAAISSASSRGIGSSERVGRSPILIIIFRIVTVRVRSTSDSVFAVGCTGRTHVFCCDDASPPPPFEDALEGSFLGLKLRQSGSSRFVVDCVFVEAIEGCGVVTIGVGLGIGVIGIDDIGVAAAGGGGVDCCCCCC